jgi:hypothetical protein
MIKTNLQKDTAQASLLLSEKGNNPQTATFAAGAFGALKKSSEK